MIVLLVSGGRKEEPVIHARELPQWPTGGKSATKQHRLLIFYAKDNSEKAVIAGRIPEWQRRLFDDCRQNTASIPGNLKWVGMLAFIFTRLFCNNTLQGHTGQPNNTGPIARSKRESWRSQGSFCAPHCPEYKFSPWVPQTIFIVIQSLSRWA